MPEEQYEEYFVNCLWPRKEVQEEFGIIFQCNCSNGWLVSSLIGHGKYYTAEFKCGKWESTCS